MAITVDKRAAHRLVDELEEDATWDDLVEMIRLNEIIERGRRESDAGAGVDVAEVRRRFGLNA